MTSTSNTPKDQASQSIAGKAGENRNESGLKVVGYIVRGNERIRRDSLPSAEQQRLAEAWSIKAMESVGYEPAHRPNQYISEHEKGVVK